MAQPASSRHKLSHGIKGSLRSMIEAGDLRPGDALPSERDLMRRHGVGRPAIREAMQALERAGLIAIRHGGRARVVEPSLSPVLDLVADSMRHGLLHTPGSLDHLKQARLDFEIAMVRRAARERSEDDLRRLRRCLSDQEAARDDPDRFLEADGALHRAIAAATGNPLFAALSEGMFRWLVTFHGGAIRVPGLEQLVLDEHAAIVDFVESGRRKRAAQAMREHLTRANEHYQQANYRPSSA